MLSPEVAILSELGGRRANEDACGHWHSERQLCCVLADGAGGHGGGAIAARSTVEQVIGRLAQQPAASGADLLRVLEATNAALLSQQTQGTERADMRSTVVCLVLDFVAEQALWSHAGDSRLYWFRQGRVLARTRDHSLVQSLVDAGLVAPGELRQHPRRSELRSALGSAAADLELDATAEPQTIAAGDAFLLCTDGVWEHLDDSELEAELQAASGPQDWLERIERRVLAAASLLRSHDNFSAVAVWLGPG